MLLWQWKNEHKKYIIWIHLIAGAFVLHIFFGLLFFSYCRHGVTHITLTMKKNSATIPVTFVPFKTKNQNVMRCSATPAVPAKKIVPPKKSLPNKTSVVKTNPAKKQPLKKVEPPKKVENKKAPKKEEKKNVSKKKEEIKKEPIKQAATKELEVAPPAQQIAPVLPLNSCDTSAPTEVENELLVTNDQAELYALVAKQWAPPVGIAHDKVCEVSAEIGWDKKIKKVWISEKSGILMYDIAARKAVMHTDFPAWTQGKIITIRFVQ